MKKVYNSISELIGSTPLLRLHNIERMHNLKANVIAKLEYLNPAGSVKDRAALSMIDAAERSGLLKSGSVIIEPTSGNTGIGLAAVAAVRGYRAIIVMPDSMSKERIVLMKAYGAEVVLTDGALGMKGAIEKAEELAHEIENSFIPAQFDNPANAEAHFNTTGPEIYADTNGQVDIFVAGVGTGGTISGIGKYLKEKNPDVMIVAVEPADSPLLSEGKAGGHKIQGIGANFVPEALDMSVIDKIVTVTAEQAYEATNELAKREGLLCGISSGAAAYVARALANDSENAGKNVVVLLPDTGERYLSAGVFK